MRMSRWVEIGKSAQKIGLVWWWWFSFGHFAVFPSRPSCHLFIFLNLGLVGGQRGVLTWQICGLMGQYLLKGGGHTHACIKLLAGEIDQDSDILNTTPYPPAGNE